MSNCRKTSLLTILLSLFLSSNSFCQSKEIEIDTIILMNYKNGKKIFEICKFNFYKNKVDSFFKLNTNEIDSLTFNYSLFKKNKNRPLNYALQIVGVYIKKEKYIFINAFYIEMLEGVLKSKVNLNKFLINSCDSGRTFWKSFFNLKSNKFEYFQYNGCGS